MTHPASGPTPRDATNCQELLVDWQEVRGILHLLQPHGASMPNPTDLPSAGTFLGRIMTTAISHPLVVTVRNGNVVDISSRSAPTSSDVCEFDDPADFVGSAEGRVVGRLDEIAANSFQATRDPARPYLLSPVDLHSVKAAGVTFVVSLLERVLEEQARGAPEKAAALRHDILNLVGEDLSRLIPGSPEAMAVKSTLIEKGCWSQYLEVGIGRDAEIFTKCQPMASVGFGADVGLHPDSNWSNPEPEIAIVVSSTGRIVGATLGNDVNLRDIEGRSALLLGKAKDNNASAALGPFIRLFDATFSLEDVESAELTLKVTGEDGFTLRGKSSMREISRSPKALVAAAMGKHHQYPDGVVLYLGTMFAPVADRGETGKGFTHHLDDVVTISTPSLGTLTNRVSLSTRCGEWKYGIRRLMKDLAAARLI